ncbi:MAG: hypothetical protein PHC75_04450 [Burkholderiales bacterium]|nr:hypothetical protein [Burkholderiales bacterium]
MFKRVVAYCFFIITLVSCNIGSNNHELINRDHNLHFESPEHLIIGSEIMLHLASGEFVRSDDYNVLNLKLSNGKNIGLSFAELVYLGGDFIGDYNQQIGGLDKSVSEQAFLQNFNIVYSNKFKEYLPEIMRIVNEQIELNIYNIEYGNELFIPNDLNRKFNCATGGGCNVIDWLFNQGLYLQLANVNYDHFGSNAIDAYLAGHSLALKTALMAKNYNNPELLNKAYAYEAFSHHFLTDLSASGHIRTPRKDIAKWCSYTPYTISLDLANVMHKEDNEQGLYITAMNGESWFAYGDAEMFIDKNNESLKRLIVRMQKSTEQIYDVYQKRISVDDAYNTARNFLPNLDKISNDKRNSPALFKMENGLLLEYNEKTKIYNKVNNCIISLLKYKLYGH